MFHFFCILQADVGPSVSGGNLGQPPGVGRPKKELHFRTERSFCSVTFTIRNRFSAVINLVKLGRA